MPYREFLTTDFWKAVRKAALQRASHRCQLCNSCETLNVHHRTYDNRGWEDEHPEDLTVLCEPCHQKHHDIIANPKQADKKAQEEKRKGYSEPHFGGGDVTNCRPMTENEMRLFREHRKKIGRPLPEPIELTKNFDSYWDSRASRSKEKSAEEIEFGL